MQALKPLMAGTFYDEPGGSSPWFSHSCACTRARSCGGAGARASLLARTFVFGGEVLRNAGGLTLKIPGSGFYLIFAIAV